MSLLGSHHTYLPGRVSPIFTVRMSLIGDFSSISSILVLTHDGLSLSDLSDGNIMMEGRGLYGKEGFHPSDQDLTAGDVTVFAKPRTRKDIGFVRYYITDFGLSVHFSDSDRPRLVTGNRHQDITVPELSSSIPYDPFPVDVFSLGNVFKRNFLDVRT